MTKRPRKTDLLSIFIGNFKTKLFISFSLGLPQYLADEKI